ncbi:hypothetical protein [Seonamhaeicola sp.]|uniref:hypothetical protein n=1 Tax=Seonamhaeicola sp. TaxID=1912245 RepID=UPI002603DF07|nr:hypothetical protein [Seonamhaeicola sp.]
MIKNKFFPDKVTIGLLLILSLIGCDQEVSLEQEALKKISTLESLMKEASSESLDVAREETILWFSKEFLKFANWDESHKDEIEKLFGYYDPYASEKTKYAEELPDFERKKVIEILDVGIGNLKKVLDGSIKRRPVNKIDWANIEVGDNMLLSHGKPVFLFDYFSKSVGVPLTDKNVYNDHLGAIFHGGSTLYEANEDRAINPYILKEDGTFDEEKLKLITDIPDTSVGFMILWNMGMPDWILKQEPEAAMSRSLFTGFDVDNPLMREVWSKVIKKSGELTKDKKVTQLGYILSNEPHWFSEKGNWRHEFKEMNAISSYTLNKFRDWLSIKYNGDINDLNENWKMSFNDFSAVEIEIPIDSSTRGTPIWYDWCRYNMDRGTDWFTFLQRELLSSNPDADTHIKVMPKIITEHQRSHGIDLEALIDLTTMIGDDAKTKARRDLIKNEREKWEDKYIYYWEELAFSYDFMESVAPGKIHVNSEAHFLSTWTWRDLDTAPEYVRSCYWLATLHGMDTSISWFWARDPDGSPEDRLEGDLNFFDPALAGSYAASANMQPQVVNEVAQVYMDMNSVSEEIIALRKQRRPVRFFYSETSYINREEQIAEQSELFESMYFEGIPLGFATEKIIKKQDHNNWDAILVYKTEYVTDSEFSTLQKYLDDGGTIILDNENSLSKNEYGQLRNKSLQETEGTLVIMDDDASISEVKTKVLGVVSNSLPEIVLKESNGTPYKGCTWRVVENENGGYIVNILNVGKNDAKLNIGLKNGKIINVTNIMTGESLGPDFELKPNGILLLEII